MEIESPLTAAVDDEMARILSSPQFSKSPRLQSLLRFVVAQWIAGKAEQIKESTVALEVFGRADTSGDSLVRSAAGRLRARLEEYYAGSGSDDPIRIAIPKGSYVPEIEARPVPPHPESTTVIRPLETHPARSWARIGAAVAAVGILSGSVLLWNGRSRAPRPNGEAQELYLKGRYYWNKRTPDDLNRAVDNFTQAVVKDPRYAQAYVGLADTYNLLSEYTTMPYQQAFQRGMAAAKTAIDLNADLPEAHNSLAYASFYGAWDAATAEREFRRALELNPNYSTAHHWYATFLMSIGRESEALAQIGQAQALDPSSKSILADKGLILLWAGQAGAAQALLEEMAAADPQFVSPHRYLRHVYLLQNRYSDYLAESKKDALLVRDSVALQVVEAGEEGYRAGGARGMLEAMVRAQEKSERADNTRYFGLAQMSALSGNTGSAMRYLELAYANHDVNMVTLTADPMLSSLRGLPAFQQLVKRVGVRRPDFSR